MPPEGEFRRSMLLARRYGLVLVPRFGWRHAAQGAAIIGYCVLATATATVTVRCAESWYAGEPMDLRCVFDRPGYVIRHFSDARGQEHMACEYRPAIHIPIRLESLPPR